MFRKPNITFRMSTPKKLNKITKFLFPAVWGTSMLTQGSTQSRCCWMSSSQKCIHRCSCFWKNWLLDFHAHKASTLELLSMHSFDQTMSSRPPLPLKVHKIQIIYYIFLDPHLREHMREWLQYLREPRHSKTVHLNWIQISMQNYIPTS